MTLLRLEAERCRWARFQAAQANWLTRRLAEAVAAIADAAQGAVNFRDQLALPVTGTQFQCLVAFGRGPVDNVRQGTGFVLQIVDRLFCAVEDVRLPVLEQPKKAS